jgi:hypothetical protein
MPRAAPMLSSFNAGELSPSVEGRVDVAKYNNGCKTLENYLMTVQGPVKRRGGTRFITAVKNSADQTCWNSAISTSAFSRTTGRSMSQEWPPTMARRPMPWATSFRLPA